MRNFYKEKNIKSNIHDNFMDLNPNFLEQRKNRANIIAKKYFDGLKEALYDKVEQNEM